MNEYLKKSLTWVYGLAATIIGGSASAAGAFVLGKSVGVDFTWQQLGMVALMAGVVNALFYLAKSPLPGIIRNGGSGIPLSPLNAVEKEKT